jgi:LacI family transcriptional regulator
MRIEQIARELGYRPNMLARGLAGGKTNSIGLLWSLAGPQRNELVNTIGSKLISRGYSWSIADHWGEKRKAQAGLTEFARRRVDAVVFNDAFPAVEDPAVLNMLKSIGPVVMTSPHDLSVPCDLVVVDRLAAVRAIADHFAASGRTRPAMLGPLYANRVKWVCFTDRLRDHNIDPVPNSGINLPGHPRGEVCNVTIAQLEKEFGDQFPFDAVWCTTDQSAAALNWWLQQRGMRVPDDVAVVGFNNDMLAGFQLPALASVDRREHEVADWIEQTLFARLESPDQPPIRGRIEMQFVWRESAGGSAPAAPAGDEEAAAAEG